jgi:hypothetical protein
MATPNPLENIESTGSQTKDVSQKKFVIGGIETIVYGLDELESKDVACLWLLHARLNTRSNMTPIANKAIARWSKSNSIGLIAVSFDQRNHGSREVDPLANQSWRDGNPRHAQDMFSIFRTISSNT